MKVLDRLSRFSQPFLLTFALLLVVLQGLVNYLVGPDYAFLIFFVLPIAFVAWLAGRRAAYAVASASAFAYFITEYASTHFDGREHVTVFNALARLAAFLFVAYFVSELRRSHEHERELARTDDLTGAVNRRSFFEAAQSEINRARRHRHPFSVAYMDVDNFKELNDTLGHAAGDAVLRAVAQEIRKDVREIDLVARLGGDEFVVLLPETDDEAARAVVSRVRSNLAALAARRGWRVTFSIGVVTWTTPPRTVDVMIRQADDAMYEVKNTGKDRVAHLTVSGEPSPAA
ncbi:MAG: GGDEF domain-containing protein [Acidobacteriota bacterium]|nr:GGDEF domain-containing protein [Acidobacteriota bacterium]